MNTITKILFVAFGLFCGAFMDVVQGQGNAALAPNTPGGDTVLTANDVYYRVDSRLGNLYQMDSLARVYNRKNPTDVRFLKKYRRRMFEKRRRQIGGDFRLYDSLATRFLRSNALAPICPTPLPNNTGSDWSLKGPFSPITQQGAGRINAVLSLLDLDTPTAPPILLAGSISGGLFRSIDNGVNWVNVTDGLRAPALGITAITTPSVNTQGDPVLNDIGKRTLYFSTGMTSQQNGTYGSGVYKSVDDGENWGDTGLNFSAVWGQVINVVTQHPRNPDIVYAGVGKDLEVSLDGGDTWHILASFSADPNVLDIRDIEILSNVTTGEDMVFVTTLSPTHWGSPNWNEYNLHVINRPNTLPSVPLTASRLSIPTTTQSNYIGIEVARNTANPNLLYVLTKDYATGDVFRDIYDPTNTINTWVSSVFIENISITTYQQPYNSFFKVNQLNPAIYYTGSAFAQKVVIDNNGTATKSTISGYGHRKTPPHADTRCGYIESSSSDGLNDHLLIGTDGGLARHIKGGLPAIMAPATNPTDGWVNLHCSRDPLNYPSITPLVATELYDMSVASNGHIVTGAQDSGVYLYDGTDWSSGGADCCDGGQSIFDYSNPLMAYANLNGALYISPNGGNSFGSSIPMPREISLDMIARQDPIDPTILHLSKGEMYKKVQIRAGNLTTIINKSNHWPILSVAADLSWCVMHPLDPCLLEKTTTGFAGLAIAPSNNQVIYLGGASHAYTDNIPRSPLYKSIDGGTTWTTFTNFWFTPTSIAVNPTDPNKVWVGFDSFAETTQNSGIGANRVKYFDGTNWIPRDAGLPPLPINALVYQPGSDDVLYAGTDVGVFKWNKSNNHWDCFSGNLPVTIVSDLEIDACSGKLYAATYGRGIWKTDLLNFSPIIPTFSLTSSINTCEAVLTATIANQSSAIHNFVWSTGEIVSSPTAMTNAITVHQSGTYTVTISGGGTCASTASIAVTVFEPTVTITPSTTQPICANTLISIDAIVNLTVPTSWHWSTPSGATTASIQVTPQAAGATTVSTTTYTVTVTDGATCTATSSIDITVFNDCCPVPPNFKEIEPRGTTTSQIVANIAVGKLLPMATAATTMQKIVISYLSGHNLLIDEDYTFFNSDIHIGTACGITIGAGKTLTLLGCTIESCSSSLWDKIEILDGGILTIDEAVYTDRSGPVRKPTTIKDSDSGIYTEQPNASISLKNTVFQDDYISVFINGSANPTPLPLYFQCNSTVFKGTPLVGSPKINVAHTGEHFPIAGLGLINSQASINPIHLDPIDGVIGGSTSFTDLSNGIISYNSTLNIGNCYFANIHDFDRMGRGNAIYAQTNGLVNFFGYQAMHHFENCDYGILANGAAIYANSPSSQGVSMRNVKYGIATTNTAEIAIERSTIAATYRGIEISGNPTNANISLNRNTISVNEASAATPSNSAAISISGAVGAGAADFSNTSITDNIITIENATTGIALTNIIGSTVKNNEVNCMEPNSNSEGILVARSPQTIVDNNTLQGSEDLTATADYTGIRIEQSAQTQITCNTTDLLKTGIKVEGICTGSQIKGNYFGEHASALWYSPTATTGPQERNGNVWTSQYNGSKIGAFNENTVSITPNLYTVNQIDDNGICIPRNSNGSPSVNPLSWFNTSPLCNKICNTACLSALNAAMNLDAEIDIALNLTKYDSAYEEGLKWADKRYLLNLLEKKTELLQDPVFMAFIDSMAVITEGKFQNIEKNTKEVITPTNQIKTLLQQYQNAILLTNQNLLLVDSLLSVIKDTTQIRALEVQYVNYKMQYIQLLSLETELMQTQDSIIKTNLPNLVLQNNALTHTAQYEENEKIVNDIFYTNQLDSTKSLVTKYRQDNKGRFTAAQKSTLLSIASQCPFEGGNAVFAARAMVSEFDKTYYNDRVICLNRGILWRTAKPKTVEAAQNTLWNITFAPNPTQGTVTIGFSNKHPKGSIQLFDVYGRLLQTNQFTETNTSILYDLTTYSAGIYLVKIQGDDNTVFTKKIVLIN